MRSMGVGWLDSRFFLIFELIEPSHDSEIKHYCKMHREKYHCTSNTVCSVLPISPPNQIHVLVSAIAV